MCFGGVCVCVCVYSMKLFGGLIGPPLVEQIKTGVFRGRIFLLIN